MARARAFDADRRTGSTTAFGRPRALAKLDLDLPLYTGSPCSLRVSAVPRHAFGGGRIRLEQPASSAYALGHSGISVLAGLGWDRNGH